MSPPLDEFPSYKEYVSSPKRFRGFCVHCGTSLIWRSDDDKRTFDLFLGTVDEKWLAGEKKADDDESTTASMVKYGGVGKTLGTPNGTQYWCENAIEGVTDLLQGGEKYARESPQHSQKTL